MDRYIAQMESKSNEVTNDLVIMSTNAKKVAILVRQSSYFSVPTQNLNWGFSYPLIFKFEGMK